jgi:hypothetical protein
VALKIKSETRDKYNQPLMFSLCHSLIAHGLKDTESPWFELFGRLHSDQIEILSLAQLGVEKPLSGLQSMIANFFRSNLIPDWAVKGDRARNKIKREAQHPFLDQSAPKSDLSSWERVAS